jgi:hypothetical protein
MTTVIQEDLPELTEEPTGTQTHYLIVHNNGTSLVGVVEMLDQWVGDDGSIQAIYLITPDGRASIVNVEDVTGGDAKNIEFEISLGAGRDSDPLAEYVCFEAEGSTDVVERQVYVKGYTVDVGEVG